MQSFTAVRIKIVIFQIVTKCSFVVVTSVLDELAAPSSTLIMEALKFLLNGGAGAWLV
jgi:hypothetical protein